MNENTEQKSVLNLSLLTETFMNNMDIVKQILLSFKDSFNSFEEEFLVAQKRGDTEAMSRLAHGLKGGAGNIRAEILSSQAANLQSKIDQGQALGDLVCELIHGLALLNKEIDSIVAG